MKQLILASESPRRKQLLELLGLPFIIHPSNIDENLTPGIPPREQVEALSLQKAQAVAPEFKNSIIIAADTMVVLGDEVIGKPNDNEEAKKMLQKFSGTQHIIVTGFTLLDTNSNKIVTKSTETKITFRKMADKEIEAYVLKANPLDKAGGYAIHELAAVFIEKIEGDCNGATGLSTFLLAQELKKFGIEVL